MEQRIFKILEAKGRFDLMPGITHLIQNPYVIYLSKLARDGLNVTIDQLKEVRTDYLRIFFNPDNAGDCVQPHLLLAFSDSGLRKGSWSN